jgi:DNA-binding NarL/FixJ family response regulator
MDLRMPVLDGAEATRQVRARHPGTQVVVLTTYADDTSILDALHAGARGYLTKDAGRDQIARALFVSEATVKTHINHLFAKTGSADRAQAVRYAYQHGLATPRVPGQETTN